MGYLLAKASGFGEGVGDWEYQLASELVGGIASQKSGTDISQIFAFGKCLKNLRLSGIPP